MINIYNNDNKKESARQSMNIIGVMFSDELKEQLHLYVNATDATIKADARKKILELTKKRNKNEK